MRTYGPAAAKPAAQRLVTHPQVATVAALFSLGSITLRRLGKQLGDTVRVAGEGWWQASRMEIVGRAVLNEAGFDGSFTSGMGGLVHPDRLRRLAGDDPEALSPGTYLIRVNPGVDRNQAIARLQRDFPGQPGHGPTLISATSNASPICPICRPRWWPCSPWAR